MVVLTKTHMTNANWLLIILIIIVVALGGGWYFSMQNSTPIITETPTTTPSTNIPTGPRATYDNATPDMIVVTSPAPGATVGQTFTVQGQARGGWYFEASFPLEVRSATGTVIALMPVQADGEWMTSSFVPFSTTTVKTAAWYKGPAVLILRNDNPSGLPENAASIEIPIIIQ